MGPALAILFLLFQRAPEDLAVRRAVEVLKTADPGEHRELVLWTLIDVGVPESHPRVQELLKDVLLKPIETTVSASLQAMILQRLDPVVYQMRIAHCAQFLIDHQAKDGRWAAGAPVDPPLIPVPPKPGPPPPPPMRGFAAPARPAPPKLELKRRSEGPETGDLVHSRWAAHGLHAARMSGIVVPAEIFEKAEAAWRREEADAADVVACLSIHLFYQQKKFKTDPDVLKALDRLGSPSRPTDPVSLASLKRAMFLFGSDTLAGRSWWPEGAKVLLDAQKPDGGWGGIEETCAAARYLHR